MKNLVILLSIITLCFSCTSKKNLSAAKTKANAESTSIKPPPHIAPPSPEEVAKLKAMQRGSALYQTKCSTCHEAYDPTTKNEKFWQDIVPEMVQKSNAEGRVIAKEESELILAYLLKVAKK
jgi:cytochrome c5